MVFEMLRDIKAEWLEKSFELFRCSDKAKKGDEKTRKISYMP